MINITQILQPYHFKNNLFDAEVLLAHVLQVSRSYLHAFSERELTLDEKNQFEKLMAKYLQGMPVAYLIGHREFWSLDLFVTPDTLIPRPESELLIEKVLGLQNFSLSRQLSDTAPLVADLGTGSGALALAMAHENSHWQIYATDISHAALEIARKNANHLKISTIIFCQGSWCDALPHKLFDIIVSNPPYIAKNDPHLHHSVVSFEPAVALFSEEDGLKDLQWIICQAQNYLKWHGWLFLEHGFQQGDRVRNFFLKAGYNDVFTHEDLAGHERVTVGRRG